VEEAATRAGSELVTAAAVDLERTLEQATPDLLILDLDAGGTDVLVRLQTARTLGLVPEQVVAYAGHVSDELLSAAAAAGCTAIPRGRLWRQLSDMFQKAD
jgi:CheY-like chemotaxis protein